MRVPPILHRAALLSLLAAGGGCVRQEPPRLAAIAVPEPETTATVSGAPAVPLTHDHWRLRYTRL